jgi:hypothetical protein
MPVEADPAAGAQQPRRHAEQQQGRAGQMDVQGLAADQDPQQPRAWKRKQQLAERQGGQMDARVGHGQGIRTAPRRGASQADRADPGSHGHEGVRQFVGHPLNAAKARGPLPHELNQLQIWAFAFPWCPVAKGIDVRGIASGIGRAKRIPQISQTGKD